MGSAVADDVRMSGLRSRRALGGSPRTSANSRSVAGHARTAAPRWTVTVGRSATSEPLTARPPGSEREPNLCHHAEMSASSILHLCGLALIIVALVNATLAYGLIQSQSRKMSKRQVGITGL